MVGVRHRSGGKVTNLTKSKIREKSNKNSTQIIKLRNMSKKIIFEKATELKNDLDQLSKLPDVDTNCNFCFCQMAASVELL